MADLNLDWNGDLSFSPSGDVSLADDDVYVRQRIQRRLFTAVYGYVWHLDYGAGLPQKVGELYSAYQISAIVKAQMALEESVAQNPPPKVTVSTYANNPGAQIIRIDYVEANSGRAIGLTLTI